MKLTPIKDTLAGEWLLGVYPTMSPETDAGWNRRLNYFTSRALTHTALISEQASRGGRLATMGQNVSHGVIVGLEVSADNSGINIMIAPGSGVMPNGEDVFVPRALNINVRNIRVYKTVTNTSVEDSTSTFPFLNLPVNTKAGITTPVGNIGIVNTEISAKPVLTGGLSPINLAGKVKPALVSSTAMNSEAVKFLSSSTADLLPRELGKTIGEYIDQNEYIPEAGILILQPIVVDTRGAGDERDPCEEDPSNDAFENWQIADGCRVIYYAWPSEYITPEYREVSSLTDSALSWRNRLAHKIFLKEKTNAVHPWDGIGVPIALVGFDSNWKLDFCDRYAVVRDGGKPRWQSLREETSGNAFLWQARVQQFNQQISEITINRSSDLTLSGQTFVNDNEKRQYLKEQLGDISRSFLHLPPVGMLPKQAIDFENNEHYFFRPDYFVEAVAVPIEQLDVALEASASMTSFDVNTPDRVRVLVPVPQVWYEPELLNTEIENPEFQDAVDRFSKHRANILDRRLDVRTRASLLNQAMTNQNVNFPSPDPDAIENDESDWHYLYSPTAPLNWNNLDYNDGNWLLEDINKKSEGRKLYVRRRFDIENLDDFDRLNINIQCAGYIHFYINSTLIINTGPTSGSLSLNLDSIKNRLVKGENLFAFECTQSANQNTPYNLTIQFDYDTGEDEYGIDNGKATDITNLAVNLNTKGLLVKLLGVNETSRFEEMVSTYGLTDLSNRIRLAHDNANDFVSLKFLKIQSDIYRVSQLMYGNEESNRLVTSPVLANIIKGESASGTKADLSKFYTSMKSFIPANVQMANMASVEFANTSANPASNPALTKKSTTTAAKSKVVLSGFGINVSDIGATAKTSGTAGITELKQDTAETLLFGGAREYIPAQAAYYQANIAGMIPYIRTTDVLQRIIISPAMEAKNAAVFSKYEIIKAIVDMDAGNDPTTVGIYFGDITIPGFVEDPASDTELDEVTKTFQEIADSVGGSPDILSDLKQGKHDPAILRAVVGGEDGEYETEPDEASYFSAAIRALEHAAAILRLIEGRLNSYSTIPGECEKTITQLQARLTAAGVRLSSINVDLAEARHDVAVSRALLLEEQQRVVQVNQRRKMILAEHVPFLSFYRPRVTDIINDVPTHILNPALLEAPIPKCLSSDADAPEELSGMMSLLRDAPVRWFSNGKALLEKLHKANQVTLIMQHAKSRSQQYTPAFMLQGSAGVGGSMVSNSIFNAMEGMKTVVSNYRKSVSIVDLSAMNNRSWKENVRQALQTVSIGDIVEGKHGNAKVSKEASELLENIERVSVCLYQHFSKTPARVRLDWAEKLSQYDKPVNLKNLYSLPRWDEVEFLDRQEMQAYVDWLHNKIDPAQSEAPGIINELVRVCLLLASHAPVNKITSGNLKKSITVKVGDFIDVAIDPSRLRVGMEVFVYVYNKPLVKAIINDFNNDSVSAKVVSMPSASITLTEGAKVQVSEPRQFILNPAIQYSKAVSR